MNFSKKNKISEYINQGFYVQSWPEYMKQTLVLVWNSALREKFSFSLVFTKFLFWEEDWALGYNSVKIWDLLNIS